MQLCTDLNRKSKEAFFLASFSFQNKSGTFRDVQIWKDFLQILVSDFFWSFTGIYNTTSKGKVIFVL